jgi:hypothetical protein
LLSVEATGNPFHQPSQQRKGAGKMRQAFLIRLLAVYLVILFAAMSAMALPGGHRDQHRGPFKEIWLKLWKPNGRILDMRVQTHPIGRAGNAAENSTPLYLSHYPFQFDISGLGDIADEDIRGIVYGFKIGSVGRPESPLMVRWWVVKRGQLDFRDPAPTRYPLTLKLRIWDSEGVEFNPDRQLARIFPTVVNARVSNRSDIGAQTRLPVLF